MYVSFQKYLGQVSDHDDLSRHLFMGGSETISASFDAEELDVFNFSGEIDLMNTGTEKDMLC